MRTLDIIIPVFNEGPGLKAFHTILRETIDKLPLATRIIYVNDGSLDDTHSTIEALRTLDSRVVSIELSRNFGHQAALSAGLDLANADFVVMMDGDGQHPPQIIPEMIRLHDAGYDIVQAQRLDDETSVGLAKSVTSRSFYRLLSWAGELKLPPGVSDFRLMSRDVTEALRSLPEYHRFIRGMISWVGFRVVFLPYRPPPRIMGKSKYSFSKMIQLAHDGMFSFSLLPLRVALLLGGAFLVLALFEIGYVFSFWLGGRLQLLVPGWSSLVVLVTVSSGAIMLLLGFIGVYIGMIFQEVKRRPIYVVRSRSQERGADRAGN